MPKPEQLTQEELAYNNYLQQQQQEVASAIRHWQRYLVSSKEIGPEDKITAEGKIIRAEKQEAGAEAPASQLLG